MENRSENLLSLAKSTFPERLQQKKHKNCPRAVPGLPWETSGGAIGALLGALVVLLERSWTFLGETLDGQTDKKIVKTSSESGFLGIQSTTLLSAPDFDPPGVDFGPPEGRPGWIWHPVLPDFWTSNACTKFVKSLSKVCPKFVQSLSKVCPTLL